MTPFFEIGHSNCHGNLRHSVSDSRGVCSDCRHPVSQRHCSIKDAIYVPRCRSSLCKALPQGMAAALYLLTLSIAHVFQGCCNCCDAASITDVQCCRTMAYRDLCCCRYRWQQGWSLTIWFNNIIIVCTLIFGMGFGMWASFQTIVSNVGEFGVFAACYNCS